MSDVSFQDAQAAGIEMYNRLACAYRRQIKRFEANQIPEECRDIGSYIAVLAMLAQFEELEDGIDDDGAEVINKIVRNIVAGTQDDETPKAMA